MIGDLTVRLLTELSHVAPAERQALVKELAKLSGSDLIDKINERIKLTREENEELRAMLEHSNSCKMQAILNWRAGNYAASAETAAVVAQPILGY